MSDYLKSIYIRAKSGGAWCSMNLDELMNTEDGQIQVKAWLIDKLFVPLDKESIEQMLKELETAGTLELTKLKEPDEPKDGMMELMGIRPITKVAEEEIDKIIKKA